MPENTSTIASHPIVRLLNINKDFQTGSTLTRVLHDITLDIYAGNLTMLVGPSGCGKTTLLSIITGILTPTSGKIFIDDVDITRLSDKQKVELRRLKIGFIFQQYNLLPALNAAENAAIPLIAAGWSLEKATHEAIKILELIDMEEHITKLPNQLSGGQQQRVAIARALIHKPSLIVCDEPTAALDATTGHKIMAILKEKALENNRAVIVVTHDNRIFEFANRIIHMDDGRIQREESNFIKYS